ncbi:TIGR03943 family putative permease subunit [Saccharopolyspora phatthalungensis]|uniref:Putative repeat protein (TIGR03943 family) n=1 Tax=Saccharopolyspora phatthalungensis TaxID=664693 RepID=A0A840PXA8_9PSEU|nr:TIGR03943 family protein [Saccharopolyspora phatthalungensis]MBB5152946.1 putative repeat protein (TIGR03943 family) [Saccharopolyspora phatthalungensis]
MRRETQNLLLLLLGGALLKIALGGSYLRYVKPSLFPWLVASGVIMIALGVFAIVRDIRAGGADQHEHNSRSPWMLLLPVFAIFLIAPPALGSDSVTRDRVAAPSAPKESLFPDLPPEEAPLLGMSEFVTRAIWDDSGALNGRTVRLQGFVVHPKPGTTQLARMRISCCAADAAPVKVDLAAPAQAAELPSDTWIEVTGKLRPGTATDANDYVPTLEARLIRPIPTPQDTYEY